MTLRYAIIHNPSRERRGNEIHPATPCRKVGGNAWSVHLTLAGILEGENGCIVYLSGLPMPSLHSSFWDASPKVSLWMEAFCRGICRKGEGGGEIIRLPLPRDLGKIFNITLGEARLVKQEKSDTFRRVMSKKGHQSSRKKLE